MAKMAVLIPYQNMLEQTEHMFNEFPQIQRFTVEFVRSELVADRAKEIESEGADVIMARGFQAKLVKHAVKLPVVEIQVTAQELGTLVLDIKELDYISSAGLRVFLSAQKAMNKQGTMVVRNAGESVMDVFEVTGFTDILTIE